MVDKKQNMRRWAPSLGVMAGLSAVVTMAHGQQTAPDVAGKPPVVVSGTVPDEAARSQLVARLRALYGADRVQDQMTVGAVAAPAQWTASLQKAIGPGLAQISHGSLTVHGQTVEIHGEVANEAARQQVSAALAQAFGSAYEVRNGVRVSVQEQTALDQTLANRIVEFEPGSAVLRPVSRPLLDEMAQVMVRFKERRFEVIGHTDAQGARAANVALSLARAQAVKNYLVAKGLPADRLNTSGQGPDRPVASNDTEAGRARNRRIEFRVGG